MSDSRLDHHRYYFKARAGNRELVQLLLSLGKGKGLDDIIARVSGPWEFGDAPVGSTLETTCPKTPKVPAESDAKSKATEIPNVVDIVALDLVWKYKGEGVLKGIGQATHVLLGYPIRCQYFLATNGVLANVIAAKKVEKSRHDIGDRWAPTPFYLLCSSELLLLPQSHNLFLGMLR